jgi:alpha-1,6-mannosyltransferase
MESLTVTANGCEATSPSMRASTLVRALGALGMAGVAGSALLIAAGAASAPGRYVPARSGGWPGWLAGPLGALHVGLGEGRFQMLTLVMCAGYALALLGASSLPRWTIAAGIMAAEVALLLGPPLISQDVFGYLGYARMGVLHGLDPYTHVAAEAPNDPVLPFIGWPLQSSPYGPLFTLGSYALVPLGLAGGLWALKAIAALAGLALAGLVARAAKRSGHSGRRAAVFVGLNPVLLELALGGAHNDLLVLALLGGALALSAGDLRAGELDRRESDLGDASVPATTGIAGAPRWPRAAAVTLVADIGLKASSGLVLPFLVLSPPRWRERARLALAAVIGLAALATVALAGFGTHALDFLGVLHDEQQQVASHSIPAETARWLGLSGLPGWWRSCFLAAFAASTAAALWSTARGADWRAMAGWATLALLLSTAWLLPWYAVWLLPLAAVCDSRRLRAATLVFCAYAVAIHLPLARPLLG